MVVAVHPSGGRLDVMATGDLLNSPILSALASVAFREGSNMNAVIRGREHLNRLPCSGARSR